MYVLCIIVVCVNREKALEVRIEWAFYAVSLNCKKDSLQQNLDREKMFFTPRNHPGKCVTYLENYSVLPQLRKRQFKARILIVR